MNADHKCKFNHLINLFSYPLRRGLNLDQEMATCTKCCCSEMQSNQDAQIGGK